MKAWAKFVIATLMLGMSLAVSARSNHTGGSHSSGSVRHSKPPSGTGANSSKQRVHSYNKRNGEHIDSHNRSTANKTQRDNWDTKGNRNPDTGKNGTKDAKR